MNINDQLNNSQKEYGINTGGYFKFQPGNNRVRILTEGEVIATHLFGVGKKPSTCYGMEKGCPYHGDGAPIDDKGNEKKPSLKYTCYLIDKNSDNQNIQLADLPYSVIKQIGELQTNDDYSFDEMPMPYDITVKYTEKVAPNDMYKVIPSPKRELISQEVSDKLKEKMNKLTPQKSVANKKEAQIKSHIEQGIVVKETREEWATRVNTEAKSKGEPELPILEYPENEIDPNDVSF